MSNIPNSYNAPTTISEMQASATANGGNDNKTLVCLFLYGAADSHNMLVPHLDPAATNIPAAASLRRSQYESARPVPSVGIPNTSLLKTPPRLSNGTLSTDPNEVAWGLHPSLSNLAQSYNGSNAANNSIRAAVLRNVGTLDRPLTKTEYLSDPKSRPDQLFAHNIQQELWMAALPPDTIRTTGWFGRAMNLIDPYFNPGQITELGTYNVQGVHLQGRGYEDYQASAAPPHLMRAGDNRGRTIAADVRDGFRGLNPTYATSRNLLHRSYVSLFNRSVAQQAALSTALRTLPTAQNNLFTNLPRIGSRENPIREQMRTAARLIYSNIAANLNQRRQAITIGFGGWDHHSALRTNQDPMLTFLDQGIQAFWQCLVELGIHQNVVLFTETDFGRTFQSNGTLGTDHAWAGHSFIMGTPVRAGLYGPEPDYTVNGPRDTGQGRFIPDISIDEYYATLLKWFGVPESLLPLVLPNLEAFPSRDLGFLTI